MDVGLVYYFCTYFDQHYLPRGLALHQSLRRHCPSFQLWVLCMDRTCYDALSQLGLADVHLIAPEDLERGDEELLRAKQNRTPIEYYFTCTPSLLLFILNNCPEVDIITYLDADLFFFADPAPIYDEIADHSIAIIEHRFPPHLRHLEQKGVYNVGWLSFRRDEHAFTCLHWWRERCVEWCYDRVEDGRFADQKYLDDWPVRFPGVVVLRHKGANLAPWNLANYKIHLDGNHVWVDEQPLIFFHFHGLKQITDWLYDTNLVSYRVGLSEAVRRNIYAPYIRTLTGVASKGFLRSSTGGQMIKSRFPQPVGRLRRLLRVCRGVLARQYIFVVNGLILI
jgi:hypothetical protein